MTSENKNTAWVKSNQAKKGQLTPEEKQYLNTSDNDQDSRSESRSRSESPESSSHPRRAGGANRDQNNRSFRRAPSFHREAQDTGPKAPPSYAEIQQMAVERMLFDLGLPNLLGPPPNLDQGMSGSRARTTPSSHPTRADHDAFGDFEGCISNQAAQNLVQNATTMFAGTIHSLIQSAPFWLSSQMYGAASATSSPAPVNVYPEHAPDRRSRNHPREESRERSVTPPRDRRIEEIHDPDPKR